MSDTALFWRVRSVSSPSEADWLSMTHRLVDCLTARAVTCSVER